MPPHTSDDQHPSNHNPSHQHEHGHNHDHETIDYGEMYAQPWVQAMVSQIQSFLIANADWLDIKRRSDAGKEERPLRVLDYACGHGTISLAIQRANPQAVCRGIDLDASQVERYNQEARQLLGNGDAAEKMLAFHGDLYKPSSQMSEPGWQDFDVAVISMALHHVRDPVEMLRLLRQRLRPGGTLIVVEFLREKKDEEAKPYEKGDMVEVIGKQRIWPGFTTGRLGEDLDEAGLEGYDVKLLEEPALVPKEATGVIEKSEMWCFFAKAVVPS